MMRLSHLLGAMLVLSGLMGCQKDADASSDEAALATLSATFVAGHLGDAGRCVSEPTGDAMGAPASDVAGAPLPCDTDCPEPPTPVCMAPSVTLEVKNTGTTRIDALSVGTVVLYKGDAVLETLEGVEVTLAPDGEPFAGLEPGATVQIFAWFSLPRGEFDESQPHTVQIELLSTPTGQVEVTTPEISPLPAIAT